MMHILLCWSEVTYPFIGAEGPEDLFEVITRFIVLPLDLSAAVPVHIVLPAVPTTEIKIKSIAKLPR
jgi:hypothetical protein